MLVNTGCGVLSESRPIAYMINLSMYTGTFPSQQLQTARVTPVFKNKGFRLDNYRPISCTPHVAKIMERVLHRQLKEHLFEHEFITGDHAICLSLWSLHRDCATQSNARSFR